MPPLSASKKEALMQVPLFKTLTPAELEAISAHATIRSQKRGSTILRKGGPATDMIVILQGRVRIGVVTEEGKEVTLRVFGPGEVVGEISLLDGKERSADVIALEDCVLLSVERSHFLSLLRASSDLCLRLMASLCERIRRTSLSLEEAIALDLPTRLGRHLRRMAEEYGVRVPGGTKIGVKLSQSDLAGLVGASREKVNRQLRAWEAEGAITRQGGYFILLRPEALPGA